MKINKLLCLAISSLLLCSCGDKPSSSSESKPVESEQTSISEENSESSSSSSLIKLDTPIFSLKSDKSGLTWSSVENATSYQLLVNEQVVESNDYTFSDEVNAYEVKVKAVGDGITYEDSDFATYSYETKLTFIGSLLNNNGVVTLSNVNAIRVTAAEGESEEVNVDLTTGIYATQYSTNVTFKAYGGYDEEHHIKYYGEYSKNIYATHLASVESPYILEDGNDLDGELTDTDLQDNYIITKFDNDWVSCGASLVYSLENKDITPDKCIKLNYWRHGTYFRFTKQFDPRLVDGYNTLSFYAKGDDISKFTFALQVDDGEYMGVYATYTIQKLTSVWTKYTIKLDDPNWKINYAGAAITPSQACQVLGYSSPAELMPMFTSFDFRVSAEPDDNWSSTYAYVDEVMLSVSNEEGSVTPFVALRDNYAGKSDANVNISLKKTDNNAFLATARGEGFTQQAEMEATVNGTEIEFKTPDNGQTLDIVMEASKGGDVLTYKSASGLLASFATGLVLNRYSVVEDFESYSETGVGYDKSHSADQKSGLRGAYYCDYYGGGSSSPMGGNGWDLMGSTDYLQLKTTDAPAEYGTKYAEMKYRGDSTAMRYINYAAYTGETYELGKCDTFSFMAYNPNQSCSSCKVRIYYVNKVTASNQVSSDASTVVTLSIPKTSEWTQFTVSINANKSVYAYSFTLSSGSGQSWLGVDDIRLYNAAYSPYFGA